MNDKQKRARAYLSQIGYLESKAENQMEVIERLRELSKTPKTQAMDGVRVRVQSDEPAFVRLLELIDKREDELTWTLQTLLELQKQANVALAEMDNSKHMLLLIHRYYDYFTWSEIGDKLHASKSTIKRWHEEALDEFKVPACPVEVLKLT